MILRPTSPEDVQAAVEAQPHLLPRGGGSKPALSTPPENVTSLELAGLSGLLEYEPSEFTFTALAGTPVSEIETLLAQHGHYLPFDPVLVRRGATLGGVVATGTSGSGRYRYGGVRDFLLGVRFVNGEGELVRGGSKVVKNAAGFDLPKLMIGSLGRLGVLTELTFKVFPRPEAYVTLQVDYPALRESVAAIHQLMRSPLDLSALDFEPPGRLWVRLGGLEKTLPALLKRLETYLTEEVGEASELEPIQGEKEVELWQGIQEFGWVPPDWGMAKIPLTANRIYALEKVLNAIETRRRYSAGGNVAWVAWPEGTASDFDFETLGSSLRQLGLAGLVLLGFPGRHRLGAWPGDSLIRRVKQALDPSHRFLEV